MKRNVLTFSDWYFGTMPKTEQEIFTFLIAIATYKFNVRLIHFVSAPIGEKRREAILCIREMTWDVRFSTVKSYLNSIKGFDNPKRLPGEEIFSTKNSRISNRFRKWYREMTDDYKENYEEWHPQILHWMNELEKYDEHW